MPGEVHYGGFSYFLVESGMFHHKLQHHWKVKVGKSLRSTERTRNRNSHKLKWKSRWYRKTHKIPLILWELGFYFTVLLRWWWVLKISWKEKTKGLSLSGHDTSYNAFICNTFHFQYQKQCHKTCWSYISTLTVFHSSYC